jgi:hypothetical protein
MIGARTSSAMNFIDRRSPVFVKKWIFAGDE